MEGLGNDFILLAGPRHVSAMDVRRWCQRRLGIGADGLLIGSPINKDRVRMEYWNADGSPSEMCGNGLRCVARYAHDQGWTDDPSFVVVTPAGDRQVEVKAGTVRAMLGVPSFPAESEVMIGGTRVAAVSLGNPHAVVMVDDLALAPVETLGPRIEMDPVFPNRTNVEFVQVIDDKTIEMRVWERGVGETLASGTGGAAAAAVAHDRGLVGPKVAVRLPGGELQVEIELTGVWTEGPATYVFSGEFSAL